MALIPEFVSILRYIRDTVYPSVNKTYENAVDLNEEIKTKKNEFDVDYSQFKNDYIDFNYSKIEISNAVISINQSVDSASASALLATQKSNEIKNLTAQSQTLTAGSQAYASFNPADGKLTIGIPAGLKGDKGDSFIINSSGTTAQRALYNNQMKGWSFLDLETSIIYFKVSDASADWSLGVPFGKGDPGPEGDDGVGIISFTFVSTTDTSGLPAKSGATDTYRVTLTNAITFDYNIYNGLDYSQELLDDKLDKKFSTFTEKEVPSSSDIFVLNELAGDIKYINWSNIEKKLKDYSGNPVGTIISVASSTAPTGYLKANGALISRTAYVDLFESIGTTFGEGDGSTTFALPDLRGEFIRGFDNGRGLDTGRTFGSNQNDAYLNHSHTANSNSTGAHTHTVRLYNATNSTNNLTAAGSTYSDAGASTTSTSGAHTHTITVDNSTTGSNETRPKNIALLYCIKY